MSRCWMLAPLVTSTMACVASNPTPGPFSAEPAAVVNRMRVIVVAPVSVAADVTVPDSILQHVQSTLVSELRNAGVSVLPPSEYQRLWDEVYGATDPIFDPYTGQRDEGAYQRAWSTFYSTLATRHGTEVVLFPELWEVEAEVSSGSAGWDGTSQSIVSTGTQILAVLDALVPDDENEVAYDYLPSGFVEALSLSIVVEDSTGAPLYSQRAGIESLRKRITSDRLTGPELFQQPERLDRAIRQALAPLIEEYQRQPRTDISEAAEAIATPKR